MKLGIDPGLTGALVLIDNDKIAAWYDMPTRPKITKGKNEVCPASLNEILQEIKDIARCQGRHIFTTLELVNGMPAGGRSMPAASAFNFGEGFGMVRAMLEAHSLPYQMVTPAKWKRAAGLLGKDKDYSRTIATQLFPGTDLGAKSKGRADAICMAYYCG